MTPAKPFTLLLALCLGCASPLASAATDLNHQRAPGMQSNDSGQMNDQGGATGSGAPGDGMGTGDGGTDAAYEDDPAHDGVEDRAPGAERAVGVPSGHQRGYVDAAKEEPARITRGEAHGARLRA